MRLLPLLPSSQALVPTWATPRGGPMTNVRRSRPTGPLRSWAGDSPPRQLVAWLIRSAIVLAAVLVAYLVITNVLAPALANGIVSQMQNH